MPATAANTAELEQWTGFRPRTAVADGVQRFADWYLGHYGLS
jgi:UDP-glucuronate 4-epimerase